MKGLNRRDRGRRIEALLEAERRYQGPPDAVREDVSERVQATLGADIGNAQVLARQIARSPHRSLALVPKVAKPALASLLAFAPIALASLGVVGAAGGVAYLSMPRATKERLLRAVNPPRSEDRGPASVLPSAPPAPPAPAASEPVVSRPAILPVAESASGMALRHRTSRVVLPPVTPVPGRDVSLAEESALLEQARSALLRGATAGALQALATHELRFPAGRMLEQREALTIQALVEAGRRDEASRRARQFRERFPGSLMLEVIQSALDTEGH